MKKLPALIAFVILLFAFFPNPVVHAGAECADCLTSNKTSYIVGEAITLYVRNAGANSPIYWTLVQNGTVVAQNVYSYRTTDANGNYTWDSFAIAATTDIGSWQVSVEAGNIQATTNFQIAAAPVAPSPPSDPNSVYYNTFFLTSDKLIYITGDTPTFYVSGAPANSAIYWQLYYNGGLLFNYTPSGKVTDSSGSWQGDIGLGPADATDTGSYLLVLKIGEQRGFVNFSEGATPVTLASSQFPAATVGQAYSGQITFSHLGSTAASLTMTHVPAGIILNSSFYPIANSDGTVDWVNNNITPNSNNAIILTGTLTQSGKYTMILNFYSGDQRFDLKAATIQVGAAGSSYPPSGSIRQGQNIKLFDGTVCLVTFTNQLRCYTSAGAFLSYGFNTFAAVLDANASEAVLPRGSFIPPQDGKILCSDRGADFGTCYLITGGKKAAFTSAAVFVTLGFKFSRVIYGDLSWMESAPNIESVNEDHRAGVLIGKNETVYLVAPQGLFGIPDIATFYSWGYSFEDVVGAFNGDWSNPQVAVMPARQSGSLNPY